MQQARMIARLGGVAGDAGFGQGEIEEAGFHGVVGGSWSVGSR